MRRRVMREIGFSRRKKVNTKPDKEKRTHSSDMAEWISQTDQLNTYLPPSLEMGLGYPTLLDANARRILSHMFSDFITSYLRIYRDKWFPSTIGNSSVFDQMLSTYAKHLLNWQQATTRDNINNDLNEIILSGHTKTLVYVRLNLGSTGDELEKVAAAIVSLACYAHLCLDMESWKMHMAAITRIFEIRRDWNPRLIGLVEWVDSIGSYDLDTPPILETTDPVAHEVVESYLLPPDGNQIITYLNNSLVSPGLIDAFTALHSLNTQLILLHSALGKSLWQTITPIEIDRLVDPVVRKFLSPSARLDLPLSIGACLRSGALLYLAEFRRRSGISPVVVDGLELLKDDVSAIDRSLWIWLLTIGAIAERSDGFFHQWLATEIAGFGIRSLSAY
ncbi:hypothetical protein TSTA_011400 [Talaromyces stipitatus ATCC 10500]|uniref:C6 finger domain protein n=1 Tax=Talaromyces stipitatus (strain ATCC 10500 / CBS 375.48 / QM 6759 / NRRL 1006) TaxID=441959 RepID=B8MHP9_TALSN|nr:uncharacterized protein TSTA_011400 [Talaromyces stipitatus ATCC 10500]EED16030.1 hypothetical protein TSTA_011400 [Talaromyces stipitatus ATCC 10500]